MAMKMAILDVPSNLRFIPNWNANFNQKANKYWEIDKIFD
jgi:hypothetical protein